ncbi:MAG TPA: nucleotidyltransferase domain-containing protein, partial [Thermoplasmata archaeon]|nr:nucleotidyltransferase domain-containing protein [Thermoplasmata archaeon]
MGKKAITVTPGFTRFLSRLRRVLHPERVILFGSRARGDSRHDSDYDLLVVSQSFAGIRWVERPAMVLRLWDLPLDLEAVCLTPSEFRRRKRELS